MNISYLWIDSLCIKQDDPEDWRKEAALMQKVYSSSLLNVSSLAASDSSQSFYVNRHPASLSFEEPLQSRMQTLHDRIALGGEEKEYRLIYGRLWDDEVEDQALNGRGWVLQERLLATRILYFGHHQAFFECREVQAAESAPLGLSMADQTMTETVYLRDMGGALLTEAQPKARKLLDVWSRIVRTYTKARLTYAKDKVIALAGIAGQLASVYQDDYLAGLWRGSLVHCLCWSRRDKSQPKQESSRTSARPEGYRAPSFSWLSIDRPVHFLEHKRADALCEILEVDVQLASDNPYVGPVTSAYLLVRGRLQKLYVVRHFNAFHAREGKFAVLVNSRLLRSTDSVGPVSVFDDDLGHFDPIGKQNLYCMPMRKRENGELDLLLLECQDYEDAAFGRIGIVKTRYEDERLIVESDCAEESTYPSLNFKDGAHTIKLV